MSLHDALLAKAFGGGSGGGVSSWNDLTDKPFGDMVEVLPETAFQYDESMGVFVFPGASPLTLSVGYDYVVRWNGVDYPCTAFALTFFGYPCVAVGNPVAAGGENNGLPFAVAYLASASVGMLGAIPLDGSTSVIVGIKAPRKLHEQYVPTQERCVYEIAINAFKQVNEGFGATVTELPLALLEAVYQRRPIYMRVRDKDENGLYNDNEFFGPASIVCNYAYIALGLAYADKTTEIFKIPEGTVINGKELTTAQILFLMNICINARFANYVNANNDFKVTFMDATAFG